MGALSRHVGEVTPMWQGAWTRETLTFRGQTKGTEPAKEIGA